MPLPLEDELEPDTYTDATGTLRYYSTGEPVPTASPMSIEAIIADDDMGILEPDNIDDYPQDIDEDDEPESGDYHDEHGHELTIARLRNDMSPSQQADVLRSCDPPVWNRLVEEARRFDEDYFINLEQTSLGYFHFGERDMAGANFSMADVEWGSFRGTNLIGANFASTSVYRTVFVETNMTGVNFDAASSNLEATLTNVIGYSHPLPDVTNVVAMNIFRDEISNPDSFINEGLADIAANGLRTRWEGTRLHYWMATEINAMGNPCQTGECDCETEHACSGSCTHCSCYTGDCDCSPDHINDEDDLYETGKVYLATVSGYVDFSWSNHYGVTGQYSMSSRSMHPHVNDTRICWGDTELPTGPRPADYMLTILGWVNQHNPSDEYRPISDLPLLGTFY